MNCLYYALPLHSSVITKCWKKCNQERHRVLWIRSHTQQPGEMLHPTGRVCRAVKGRGKEGKSSESLRSMGNKKVWREGERELEKAEVGRKRRKRTGICFKGREGQMQRREKERAKGERARKQITKYRNRSKRSKEKWCYRADDIKPLTYPCMPVGPYSHLKW